MHDRVVCLEQGDGAHASHAGQIVTHGLARATKDGVPHGPVLSSHQVLARFREERVKMI